MARPRKAKPPPPPKAAAPSLAEALLLATVCMVGLPVEVQVRDGSAYAGVLHTVCVDDGYGEQPVPFPSLSLLVETCPFVGLVDRVHVGFLGSWEWRPPCDPTVGGVERMVGLNCGLISYRDDLLGVVLKKAKKITNGKGDANMSLGAFVDTLVVHPDDLFQVIAKLHFCHRQAVKCTMADKAKNTSVKKNGTSVGSSTAHVESMNGASRSAALAHKVDVTNSVIASPNVASDVKASRSANNSANMIVTSSKTTAKIMGHNASRLDPARVGSPYHPIQVGATYTSPTPQPVMNGKFSPVVYVHPISQFLFIEWNICFLTDHGSTCKIFYTGNVPVYLAPPVMATGSLPLVVPCPAPLVQPFQAMHPIMVPAASSMVPGKYM
ncbi:hypothetical protein HU200_064239 [Digitaria exilis]|uniref:Ataxin 2 SM domain-containing protein n=1 Tax=Digitaria exilis TaxID=1010633 RepID=A0A835A1X6_9POAL|nr:hypothetical protein HU200_064239 [Digitaria exilis]